MWNIVWIKWRYAVDIAGPSHFWSDGLSHCQNGADYRDLSMLSHATQWKGNAPTIGSSHCYSRDVFLNITQHCKKTTWLLARHVTFSWSDSLEEVTCQILWTCELYLKRYDGKCLRYSRDEIVTSNFFSQIHAKFVLKIKEIFIFNFYLVLGHIVGLGKTQLNRMLLHW